MWQSIINTENANKLLEIDDRREKNRKRRNRCKKKEDRDMSYIDSDSKMLIAHKIRLKPTKSQKIMFNKMFGCYRFAYNRAVNIRKNEYAKKQEDIREDRIPDEPMLDSELKKLVANEENYLIENIFMRNVPAHIRSEACIDYFKAYKSTIASLTAGLIPRFEMKYKRKDSQSQSINIGHTEYKRRGVFYPTFFDNTVIKSYEPLPDKLDHDFRLVKTKTGRFYLCYTIDVDDPYLSDENNN